MQPSTAAILKLLAIAGLLSACNFSPAPQGGATPTIQGIISTATAEVTPTPLPTATLSVPQVESATSTATPAPPTITPTATNTPGPYEYTIQAGDSLISIIQNFGYTDFSTAPGSIISEVVRINDNILDADTLPGPGSVILIPRQTATPTPANTEAAVAMAATNDALVPNIEFSDNTTMTQYVVQEGDTIISVASEYNLTLEQIAVLNPELDFFSCNFEIPSGGTGCNVPLQIGQPVNIPAPTPTPTLSPTPSGSETPTLTPTYSALMLIYPPQGGVAQPSVFSLQWVGVGVLQPEEVYLVQVTDVTYTNASTFYGVTRDTSYPLPESLIPTDGQTHTFNWAVSIAKPNPQGAYATVSGQPQIRSFQWQSR
jgi:LysM repeat protein